MSSIEPRPVVTAAIQAADDAHGAVRELIRLSLQRPAYEYPSDLDAVIFALQLLAEELPQAIRQAEEWLDVEEVAGRLQDKRSPSVTGAAVAVESVALELTAARVVARRLSEHLRAARAHTSHLAGRSAGAVQ